MNELNIKLTGLTCEACVKIASKRIRAIEGVEEVAIELATGAVTIKSCHELQVTDVEKALSETHYSIVK